MQLKGILCQPLDIKEQTNKPINIGSLATNAVFISRGWSHQPQIPLAVAMLLVKLDHGSDHVREMVGWAGKQLRPQSQIPGLEFWLIPSFLMRCSTSLASMSSHVICCRQNYASMASSQDYQGSILNKRHPQQQLTVLQSPVIVSLALQFVQQGFNWVWASRHMTTLPSGTYA